MIIICLILTGKARQFGIAHTPDRKRTRETFDELQTENLGRTRMVKLRIDGGWNAGKWSEEESVPVPKPAKVYRHVLLELWLYVLVILTMGLVPALSIEPTIPMASVSATGINAQSRH